MKFIAKVLPPLPGLCTLWRATGGSRSRLISGSPSGTNFGQSSGIQESRSADLGHGTQERRGADLFHELRGDNTRKAGFTLVEVTLALGVAAFCLLAIFGLLPVGLRSNQAAIAQTVATGILSAVAADLRSTPSVPGTTGTTTGQFAIPIPASADTSGSTTLYFSIDRQCSTSLNGTALGTETATRSTHRVVVSFVPNVSGSNAATYASLQVTWPAEASPAYAAGSVQTFVALDRN